jgi:glyoxylase-like metal-dependent hydrolase (beta-lactamase superfamily II)
MTWQSTAKRLAAHPRWEWQDGMLVHGHPADGTLRVLDYDEQEDFTEEEYPDLTDWATVGVLLGMVVEAGAMYPRLMVDDGRYGATKEGWAADCKDFAWGNQHFRVHETPGHALAQLLLELWGEG